MHKLSDFLNEYERDGEFKYTNFVNTNQSHSLCFATSERYFTMACENAAVSAIIATPSLARFPVANKGLAVVEDPELCFYHLHNRMVSEHGMCPILSPGIASSASIHPSAHIDDFVQIGEDVEIGPGSIVLDGSIIENGVVVGPNVTVGADGHFFKRTDEGLLNVRHAGGVWLRSGSHLLAGAIVSKAVHSDFTEIGESAVVSVKAHVAHGCKIGARTILAGSVQVSGYTQIGADSWIGPGSVIGNLLRIGDRVRVEAGSVVVNNIGDDARVSGNYALPHARNMKEFARKLKG